MFVIIRVPAWTFLIPSIYVNRDIVNSYGNFSRYFRLQKSLIIVMYLKVSTINCYWMSNEYSFRLKIIYSYFWVPSRRTSRSFPVWVAIKLLIPYKLPVSLFVHAVTSVKIEEISSLDLNANNTTHYFLLKMCQIPVPLCVKMIWFDQILCKFWSRFPVNFRS